MPGSNPFIVQLLLWFVLPKLITLLYPVVLSDIGDNVFTAPGVVPITKLYFNPFCGVSVSVLLSQLSVTSASPAIEDRFVGVVGSVFEVDNHFYISL